MFAAFFLSQKKMDGDATSGRGFSYFSGYARRIDANGVVFGSGGGGSGGGRSGGSSSGGSSSGLQHISTEMINATTVDLENMQQVAASWLEDSSITLGGKLASSIDAFVMKVAFELTGDALCLCRSAAALSKEWRGLNVQIQMLKVGDAVHSTEVEGVEAERCIDVSDCEGIKTEIDMESGDDDVSIKAEVDEVIKTEADEKNCTVDSQKRKDCSSEERTKRVRQCVEDSRVRLRGSSSSASTWELMIEGTDLTEEAPDMD